MQSRRQRKSRALGRHQRQGKKGKGCWPPRDGTYSDESTGISLILSNGASRAEISLPSALLGTCLPLPMQTGDVPATVGSSSLSASGTVSTGSALVKWSAQWKIKVSTDLSYVATVQLANRRCG